MKRREALRNIAASTLAVALPSDALDTEPEILEQIIEEQVDYVDPSVVDQLERLAAGSFVDYAVKHSAILAPDVKRWNRWVTRLLRGNQRPSELERLQAVGCRFAGVLSEISGDLGEHNRALLYALQSFTRANRQGDPNFRAWSRSVQSRAAFGAGDFAGAVDLARQPGEHAGHQAARLAFDEARALAEMGDKRGVDNAVERGMSSSRATIDEVYTGVTLDSYDLTLSGRAACCAYATVGEADKAREYAESPLQTFDKRALPYGAAIRMELAITLVGSDPPQAGELVMAAMDYSAKRPYAAIVPRIKNFLAAAQSSKVTSVPAVRNAVDAARAVLR